MAGAIFFGVTLPLVLIAWRLGDIAKRIGGKA
jgi:hypothetical protein